MTAPPDTTAKTEGPLVGCRVLELGSTIAAPFCGRFFADFGAEVIKVETPSGDPLRSIGQQHEGKSLWWASMHRNKRVIAVNMKSEDGLDIVKRMMGMADIVIENYRPKTMERWGLDWETMSRVHPRLIMVRISGFGQTGPYSDRAGFGIVGEALSGLRSLTGDPDRPPARVALPLTDYVTGLYAVSGALMALHHRDRTGHGQVVDAALYESAFSFMESFVPAYDKLGAVPLRTGSALPGHVPNNLFPTGDDQHIHIAAGNDNTFRA
ncbi:MAG: CoA transferase, partial [Alphaproteobacteria bacterium]|nr:CoA transferase [Alphaproteobacteria bacterium]